MEQLAQVSSKNVSVGRRSQILDANFPIDVIIPVMGKVADSYHCNIPQASGKAVLVKCHWISFDEQFYLDQDTEVSRHSLCLCAQQFLFTF